MMPFGYKVITSVHITEEGTIPIAVRSRKNNRRGIIRHMRAQVPSGSIFIQGDTIMCHPIMEREILEVMKERK